MKTNLVLLKIAGGISLFFMIFHLAFFKMLDWQHTLSCLSQGNRAILLTYHYISILITGFMGILPLIQARALLQSKLKYSVLGMFIVFFLIRIVTEFTLFGFMMPGSPIILIMCIVPIVLFAIPMFSRIQEK
jgi:hypothetical protein